MQYYFYCDYVSLFLKLSLLFSTLVLPAINMPPPRRSQSPAPLRRRLRERSATVGHRFRRQRHDAQRAADNDVHLLKRKIIDAELKLDRANEENVFLKKTIASKDEKLALVDARNAKLSRRVSEATFESQCAKDALKAEREKHRDVFNEIAKTAMHWYKHFALQFEDDNAVDKCSGLLSVLSYADAAKQIEGDNKEPSDGSSSLSLMVHDEVNANWVKCDTNDSLDGSTSEDDGSAAVGSQQQLKVVNPENIT